MMTTDTKKSKTLLEVKDLCKHYPIRKGLFSRISGYVYAVDGISFTINEGETLGLVGESGCGKSTVGRTILKLIEPSRGEIIWRGERIDFPRLKVENVYLLYLSALGFVQIKCYVSHTNFLAVSVSVLVLPELYR